MPQIHLKKNEATEIVFPMVSSASPDSFVTGETVTDDGYYQDGGSWTALAITDTVAEIGSTGLYELSMTSGEMNHDNIAIKFTATNSQDTFLWIKTYTNDIDDGVNVTSWNGTAVATPDTAGYPVVTVKDGTGAGELNLTSGVVDANLTQIGGDAQSATDLKDFADAGYNPATNYITGIDGTKNTLDDLNDFDETADPVELLDSGGTAGTSAAELVTDIFANSVSEPGTGAPATPATFSVILGYLYKWFRNKKDETSSTWKLYNDGGGTVGQQATITDSAGTTTKGELASG